MLRTEKAMAVLGLIREWHEDRAHSPEPERKPSQGPDVTLRGTHRLEQFDCGDGVRIMARLSPDMYSIFECWVEIPDPYSGGARDPWVRLPATANEVQALVDWVEDQLGIAPDGPGYEERLAERARQDWTSHD